MVTTAIWDVTDRLDRVIDYATNPDKTENLDFLSPDFQGPRDVLEYTAREDKAEKQFYITGINCVLNNDTWRASLVYTLEYPDA